jgi:hypothetical protein
MNNNIKFIDSKISNLLFILNITKRKTDAFYNGGYGLFKS